MSIKLNVIAKRFLSCFDGVRRVNHVRSASTYFASNLIKKSVYISTSTNIFENLAIVQWLYRNIDFSKHHVLFLWKNDPCIVFGRHQNPWLECNVYEAEKKNITLARRYTIDDGIVYHDRGTLNLTFFTPTERYNPKYNLDIIRNTLIRHWGLRSEIDERDNIMIDGNTILSGTASKLGKTYAYYHCSLSVDVNKINLNSILDDKNNDIVTNGTTSKHSTIKNLSDINSHIQINDLIILIDYEYMNTKIPENEKHDFIQQKDLKYIIPTEIWFPGINKFISKFRSWEWNFGKTPKFTIIQKFDMPGHENKIYRLNLKLEVENGIVKEVKMSLPPELILPNFDEDATVLNNYCGAKYTHKLAENIITQIGGKIASNMNQV